MERPAMDNYMHIWKMLIAVCWSVLFQFSLFSIYITIMDTNFWNFSGLASIPFHWFSIKSLYFIPLAAVVFLVGFVWSINYNKPQNTHFINRRFLLILNLFSYDNCFSLKSRLLLGITISAIYATLSNGPISSISVQCMNENNNLPRGQLCLNERKFFLILGGIWIALYTFFKDYSFNTKSLIFPPIQQLKFRRFKSALIPCLKRCICNAVFPSVLYCVCYYFKGNFPRFYFRLLLGLEMSEPLLDSFYEMLDVQLLVYLWLFSTIYLVTLDIMILLINIYLTERAYFPLCSFLIEPHDKSDGFFLQDALMSENIPVIHHLGYKDLSLLSQMDYKRRQELYMISQPGGHPHNWRTVVNQCFKLIDKFTVELDKCIEDSQPQVLTKPEKPVSDINQSSCTHFHQHSFKMRNLSTDANIECNNQSPTIVLQKSYDRLIDVYLIWFHNKFDAFCKKPVIAYLFGEMNEPKVKHLLLQSQPVTWAVESLSYLVCHSLKEDSFGVAQEDIPKVISVLLHLKNSIDKLNRQSILITKSNKLNLVDIQLKNALRCTLRQSIYRIAILFKDFIYCMKLKPLELMQMKSFVEFEEV